jgi:4a-hydroxytetrahydrobiopterin dehydratase
MKEQTMGQALADKKCIPCEGGVPPLKGENLKGLMLQLNNDWKVIDEHHLEKSYKFKNFKQALDYTNRVGAVAEEEGHHPDIYLSWGKVKLQVWTHKIDGLTESDFFFAAKADRAL